MQPLINYFRTVIRPNREVRLFALRTVSAGLPTLYLAFVFDLKQRIQGQTWSVPEYLYAALRSMPGGRRVLVHPLLRLTAIGRKPLW